jgi:predicted nuclease of restriction endonuclease-like (RecB) superfamily
MEIIDNNEYRNWLVELKHTILQSQIKAALAVNSQLIMLYWNLGLQIVEKQEYTNWGSGFLDQLSKDLKNEFPDLGGFSKRNLELIRQWFLFYKEVGINTKQLVSQLNESKEQETKQLVSQNIDKENQVLIHSSIEEYFFNIPWGHHILIVQKIKNKNEAIFYIKQTIEYNWSRAVLLHNIESNLYSRQGKTINNFATTLPMPQSDLAIELMKDPYCFDFLQLTQKYNEDDLEKALTNNITQFLLELGKGFSFVGKQYIVSLAGKDYKIDLLFYHLILRCFVVIELKVVDFEPEFAGKLNFYLNVVDDQLKHPSDNPTLGIIICKTKNNIEAEYALRGIEKPIGISEYELQKLLPDDYKNTLPTIEEIEKELNKYDN